MKIVITGASSGLGECIVKEYLVMGNTVIGLARDGKKLEQLSSELANDNFFYFQTDIRNAHSVADTFSRIKDQFGLIDVLVNNASVFLMKNFIKFSIKEIDDIIDTNLKGTIYCTLEALRCMTKGRIINIGSVSGTHGIENQAVYSSSKFGLNGFAESLNQELIRKGILITTLCPGGINTPLWNETNEYPGDKNNLLDPADIVKLIKVITALPDNFVFKTASFFPSKEWH